MAGRLSLQTKLEEILGSRNVYYQPPASVHLKYPAIVYELDDIESKYADDGVYLLPKKYSITVIDENPDSVITMKIASIPTCRFNRHYTSDNLNHDVFTLNY